MSDVRGYIPGQTGTLADVVERGPELRQVRPAGPDSFAPPASFGELFGAYRTQSRAYRSDFDEAMLRDGYTPIVDALGLPASENPGWFYSPDPQTQARVGTLSRPSGLATSAGRGEKQALGSSYLADRGLQEELVAEQIRARRAKDRNFLPGVPDTVDGLHDYFLGQEKNKRQASSATIARGPGGVRQLFAGFAGGAFESFHDPLNLMALPFGGGGKTLLQTFARDALFNGALEALQLPQASANLGELGEHLTAGEAATDVLTAGVFGGAFGATLHAAGDHVGPTLFRLMPDSVQQRWAARMKVGDVRLGDLYADMDNRELAGFAKSAIGEERMTPDEKSAANVLEREQELGEASPFMPGPQGDGAHNASLADALKSIIDGAPRESPKADLMASSSLRPAGSASAAIDVGRASVPHDIVDFFKAKGLDEAHAYGIAAGIMAESGGNHTVVNRSSGASFLGQWLGSRLDALRARYGPNPTREQQLEFLWHELNGGDPGGKHVLAAGDAGSVLDAYIRKFMRPAAGAETLSDLERGMEALGRKGELPEGSAAGAAAGDEDAIAALRREADQADQEALDLAAAREEPDADLAGGRARVDAADLPILKRELFGSDADWFDAQLSFARSQGLMPEGPPELAGGAAARDASAAAARQPAASGGAPGAFQGLIGPVYHGTNRAFDNFELKPAMRQDRYSGKFEVQPQAFFFSEDPETAKMFAEDRALVDERLRAKDRGEPRVSAHHLRVEQPFDMVIDTPKELSYYRENGFPGAHIGDPNPERANELFALTGSEPETWDDVQAMLDDPGVVDALRRDGYDAVRLREADGSISWAVFDPEQILSPADVATAEAAQVRIDEPALKAFEDPRGSGFADLADSLEHDYRAQLTDPERAKRTYEVGDKRITLTELLDEFDRDREAAAALRACAGGGA